MTVHYFACRAITNTGTQDFACSAYRINYLYFKDHKFLTIHFTSPTHLQLRFLPILEIKNLKYRGIKQFP